MKKVKRSPYAIALVLAITATLLMTACTGTSTVAVPSVTAAATKQAGIFTKDVNACFTNDSAQPVTFSFDEGSLRGNSRTVLNKGESFCAQAAEIMTSIRFPNNFSTTLTVSNPLVGAPAIKYASTGYYPVTDCDVTCIEEERLVTFASASYAQEETVGSDVEGHHFEATRKANTDVINFTISIKS